MPGTVMTHADLGRLLRIDPDTIQRTIHDRARDTLLVWTTTGFLEISGEVIRREFPPPDPFVEAFKTVAVAIHDAKKRRISENEIGTDRNREGPPSLLDGNTV